MQMFTGPAGCRPVRQRSSLGDDALALCLNDRGLTFADRSFPLADAAGKAESDDQGAKYHKHSFHEIPTSGESLAPVSPSSALQVVYGARRARNFSAGRPERRSPVML